MILSIAADERGFVSILPGTQLRAAAVVEGHHQKWNPQNLAQILNPETEGISEVRIAIEPQAGDLDFSDVSVIRLSPASSPALGPLSGWPRALAEPIRSRVRVANGGTRLLGARHAFSSHDELIKVIDDLFQAGSRVFAVAATGALSDAEPEERLAMLIRERVPNAIVVLSAEIGGVGLRERENCAILNAGLVRWAAARTSELSKAFPHAEIYIGRGSGGMVSADYFERFPMVALKSANGAILSGVIEQHSLQAAVVAIPQGDREFASLYFVNGGQVAREELNVFAGVCVNLNAFRTLQVPVDKLDGAGAEWDGLPLIRLEDAQETDADEYLRLRAAAHGLVNACVRTELTRIVYGFENGITGSLTQSITDDLSGRAITAGAHPLRLGVPRIEAAPMAYLPEGSLIVRAVLSGENR
ncbi:hypothetical protein [Arthrobacter cryoconiti]|uniref:Uncharacterized protein n=1 Tax=Arthrobacter cryoconiti TaxID=748907 RepID=A0ABV8QZN5_9MICC|nr:hypothetical protein [Arthrobacter cryoconiti]MCC9068599.1 hypothetical protein [Arthrobacter cryoconiti]